MGSGDTGVRWDKAEGGASIHASLGPRGLGDRGSGSGDLELTRLSSEPWDAAASCAEDTRDMRPLTTLGARGAGAFAWFVGTSDAGTVPPPLAPSPADASAHARAGIVRSRGDGKVRRPATQSHVYVRPGRGLRPRALTAVSRACRLFPALGRACSQRAVVQRSLHQMVTSPKVLLSERVAGAAARGRGSRDRRNSAACLTEPNETADRVTVCRRGSRVDISGAPSPGASPAHGWDTQGHGEASTWGQDRVADAMQPPAC